MTSKERVIKTLTFDSPDRIPVNFWCLPATRIKYGEELARIEKEADADIISAPFKDLTEDPRQFEVGSYTDAWGAVWNNHQAGIIGEVKQYPLADYAELDTYVTPKELLLSGKEGISETKTFIAGHPDKFILGGWINPFERMQFLRGTENLFMDILMESDEFFRLRDLVEDYYTAYLELWLQTDVDGIIFADDWGTQRSLLISPDSWRALFKPMYSRLFGKAKAAGKFVFMHSDGYIYDLYDEFIEIGVDAINSQVWCMGLEKVAGKCNGRITNWGEICRQRILPTGSESDVQEAIEQMKQHLFVGGGLIGQFEAGPDMPIENIRTGLQCWNLNND